MLGFVGNTGDAQGTPTHLHFEIHPVGLIGLGYDGAVNPTTYLLARQHLLDVSFADLGFDSLALLEAVGAIEREYELSLPDSVAAAPTPREMIELVSAAR